MRLRFLLALALGCTAGCDLSGPSVGSGTVTSGPGGNPTPGGTVLGPFLISIEPSPLEIAPGDEIRLNGINFSNDLASNKVTFLAGNQKIQGLPLHVEFPDDGNSGNGLESQMTVIVPGGISKGNIELLVEGISAGAQGYDAQPEIMAWTLGLNEKLEVLRWEPLLTEFRAGSFVRVYGINFNDLQRVELEDSAGQQFSLLPVNIERNPAPPGGARADDVRTGYSVIGFNLSDDELGFPFAFDEFRDNLKVTFVGASGKSNVLEIPVISESPSGGNPTIGAVISGVKVPTGTRTGPVRIFYNMYDTVANTNHRMEVFWEVDVPDSSGQIVRVQGMALPDISDPRHSGLTGVVPGCMSMLSEHKLLPGFGGLRTYTWDAPHDVDFQELFEREENGVLIPRYLPIRFIVRPILENDNPEGTVDSDTQATSAQILYYNLEDRLGDEVPDLREFTAVETFDSDENEDRLLTTASYGPEDNPGAIVGTFDPGLPDPFGEGTETLLLENTDQIRLPSDAQRQYFLFDTDELTITYKQIKSDGQTPCDPFDDDLAGSETILLVYIEDAGRASKEFHLASLVLGPDVEVLARGENPLILRLSGVGVESGQPVFEMQSGSLFDLNGCVGGTGPRILSQTVPQGRGGKPGAGGGRGGDGARADGEDFIATGQGGLDGGMGGESTLAYNPDVSKGSSFWGPPGGGGGNRTAGGAGDGGNPDPARFQAPRGGDGGRTRGDNALNPLSPGSGGGGGGASVGLLPDVGLRQYTSGAGGGGGGGALRLVANGPVLLDPGSFIDANGGKGGDAFEPVLLEPEGHTSPGPGGGGSGGCIFIQSNATVDVTCENVQVRGGKAGIQTLGAAKLKQNLPPGSGNGGEGWIRIESGSGGAPTCTALFAETHLVSAAQLNDIDLRVASVEGFPQSGGTLLLSDPETGEVLEEVTYVTATQEGATMTIEGTSRGSSSPALPVDTVVSLKGPVDGDSLSEGGIVESPDELETGRGRDREIHIRFEPSTNPATGEPLRDLETGKVLSIWTFETDEGLLRRPNGDVLFETDAADTDPGLIDATRFRVDADTILRAVGRNALRILVAGPADIAGVLDISGAPGGIVEFNENDPTNPFPGVGGAAGAGGGRGGDGGRTQFLALDESGNPDLTNKDPANTLPIHGMSGQASPGTPPDWDQTAVNFGGGHPENDFVSAPSFTRPRGGVTLRGQGCGLCTSSAGGGAGGGNREAGGDGRAVPSSEAEKLGGKAGSAFGLESFRFDGVWPYGGIGGAGGGASPHVSGRYRTGIEGDFRFPSGPTAAQHSPGTGGGGGGGVLHIVADSVIIRESGSILARGGDAYQSIDLGGNGGAGAGGNVFIQARSGLTLVTGSRIDVSGGLANQLVPVTPGQELPEYPGNIRLTSLGQLRDFGGVGGDGAAGRVRLEGTAGSLVSAVGLNSSVSAGSVLIDTAPSVGVSKAIRLGFGPGRAAYTHDFDFGASVTRYFEFGQPPRASSVVFWQGAEESLDIHGSPGPFSEETLLGTVNPETLHGREFVRFVVHFLSNTTTQEVHSIRQLELPFSLPASN